MESIFDGETVSIVVKIGKDLFPLFSPFSDLSRPFLKLIIRIVGAIEELSSVETKVDEVGGDSVDKRKAGTMSYAEAEIEFFEYPETIRAEPGFVPELKGVAKGFGTGKG